LGLVQREGYPFIVFFSTEYKLRINASQQEGVGSLIAVAGPGRVRIGDPLAAALLQDRVGEMGWECEKVLTERFPVHVLSLIWIFFSQLTDEFSC
jgi:hypothetical protein